MTEVPPCPAFVAYSPSALTPSDRPLYECCLDAGHTGPHVTEDLWLWHDGEELRHFPSFGVCAAFARATQLCYEQRFGIPFTPPEPPDAR